MVQYLTGQLKLPYFTLFLYLPRSTTANLYRKPFILRGRADWDRFWFEISMAWYNYFEYELYISACSFIYSWWSDRLYYLQIYPNYPSVFIFKMLSYVGGFIKVSSWFLASLFETLFMWIISCDNSLSYF